MRRLLLTLLFGLVLAPAAVAAVRASGDGVLELRNVSAAKATVYGRGAIWGQFDSGSLKVVDRNLDDGLALQVSGAEKVLPTLDDGVLTTTYRGKDIHFRFAGGRYQLTITGSGIDLTAVGVGRAWLVGDPAALDAGDYLLDNGRWTKVPPVEKKIVFGVGQPPAAP